MTQVVVVQEQVPIQVTVSPRWGYHSSISVRNITMTANVDYLFETNSITKPFLIQIWDNDGNHIYTQKPVLNGVTGFWEFLIYSVGETQTVEVTILYLT